MLQISHHLPLCYPSNSVRQSEAKVWKWLHQHSSTVKCGGITKTSQSNSAENNIHYGAAHILLLAKYKV